MTNLLDSLFDFSFNSELSEDREKIQFTMTLTPKPGLVMTSRKSILVCNETPENLAKRVKCDTSIFKVVSHPALPKGVAFALARDCIYILRFDETTDEQMELARGWAVINSTMLWELLQNGQEASHQHVSRSKDSD